MSQLNSTFALRAITLSILILDSILFYRWLYVIDYEEELRENLFNTSNNNQIQLKITQNQNLRDQKIKAAYDNVPNIDETSKESVDKILNNFILPNKKDQVLRINPEILLYNRVPKCGSTTMLTLLKGLKKLHSNSKNNEFELYNDIYPNQKHFLPTLEMRLEYVQNVTNKIYTREISGPNQPNLPVIYVRHIHFVNFTRYGYPMPLYINLIRDPVEHFISNYYFLRKGFAKNKNLSEEQRKKWDHHDIISDDQRNVTLADCIKKQLTGCKTIYSDIIPYFCGNDVWCRKRNSRALEAAKNNIESSFMAVGILEDLPNSLKLFEYTLPTFFKGLGYLYRKNSQKLSSNTKTSGKLEESEKLKDYLRERLKPEMELYAFVRDLMYRRLDKFKNQ